MNRASKGWLDGCGALVIGEKVERIERATDSSGGNRLKAGLPTKKEPGRRDSQRRRKPPEGGTTCGFGNFGASVLDFAGAGKFRLKAELPTKNEPPEGGKLPTNPLLNLSPSPFPFPLPLSVLCDSAVQLPDLFPLPIRANPLNPKIRVPSQFPARPTSRPHPPSSEQTAPGRVCGFRTRRRGG